MDFDQFKEVVKDSIKEYLPEDYEKASVEIRDVIKNNDTHLSGLTIRSEGTTIAPTLYLEDFYSQYEAGKDMDEIMINIAEIYDGAAKDGLSFDKENLVNQLTDYEATKDKIIPRVVNKESNEERLKGMPHTDMGDLAITYHVDLGDSDGGQMSVAVSNEMMDKYGVSVSELHDQACKNMEEVSPTSFETMIETLANLMIPDYENMTSEEKAEARAEFDMPDPGMYVLSNGNKSFGAAAMLDTDTMDKIREEVGDFYILPSSVHEVLIVPKREDMHLSDLEAMVQEVNATQVAPNEVLSDHVYEYDPETKEIFRADKAEEHMKEKEASKETEKERPSLKAKLEEKKKEVKEAKREDKTKELSKDMGRG